MKKLRYGFQRCSCITFSNRDKYLPFILKICLKTSCKRRKHPHNLNTTYFVSLSRSFTVYRQCRHSHDPFTGSSSILLSTRTQYSCRAELYKNKESKKAKIYQFYKTRIPRIRWVPLQIRCQTRHIRGIYISRRWVNYLEKRVNHRI